MSDTPQTQPAPPPEPEKKQPRIFEDGAKSHIFSISLRGWLAIMFAGTACWLAIRGIKPEDWFTIALTAILTFYFSKGANNGNGGK